MPATARFETETIENSGKNLPKTADPMEKLRSLALARGASGIKGLARMFRIIDEDGNRKLDFNEFSRGVHEFGLNLPKEEIKVSVSINIIFLFSFYV